VLEGTRITATGALLTRSADFDEIVGYRDVPTRQSTTPRIFLRNGRHSILIGTELAQDSYFKQWLSQLKKLDQNRGSNSLSA